MNIYINNGETKIPEDETCYIVAKGGIYLRKKLDLIESLTPIDKISFLEDIPSFAKINIPKISLVMFGNILSFFKEVYKLHRSEAVVLIFYNKEKKSFKLYVPEQEVSSAKVNYKSDKTIKGHLLIGTIHSHASMTAFHSGTDVGDEKNFDGIHFTVGKVDEEFFDICGCVVSNGLRSPILPQDYINGLEFREYTKYFPHMFRPSSEIINGEKVYSNTVKSSYGYSLSDESKEILSFNSKWLEKVKERTYATSTTYRFVDGKLVKVENENEAWRAPWRAPYRSYNHGLFEGISYEFDEFDDKVEKIDPCKTCVHRKTDVITFPKEEPKKDIIRRQNHYLNDDYLDRFYDWD